MTEVLERQFSVWGGTMQAGVQVAGEGPPLVYLHGCDGLVWNQTLAALASRFTVYAPHIPGTTPGDPNAIHSIRDLQDLVLFYLDVIDALELDRPALVGYSLGGMLAAEIAATAPSQVGPLVLMSSMGLWRDDSPIPLWTIMPEQELREHLFLDPDGRLAEAHFTPDEDPAAAAAAQLRSTWARACTAKFWWPLPDRGLRGRLHRVKSPTLVVWGEGDRMIPPVYAQDFADSIEGARLELIPGAAHMVQLEQPDVLEGVISSFVASVGSAA